MEAGGRLGSIEPKSVRPFATSGEFSLSSVRCPCRLPNSRSTAAPMASRSDFVNCFRISFSAHSPARIDIAALLTAF